jgi:hypothetical protein
LRIRLVIIGELDWFGLKRVEVRGRTVTDKIRAIIISFTFSFKFRELGEPLFSSYGPPSQEMKGKYNRPKKLSTARPVAKALDETFRTEATAKKFNPPKVQRQVETWD